MGNKDSYNNEITRMDCLMKRIIIGAICVLAIGAVVSGLYICHYQKTITYTFEEISGSRSLKIHSASDKNKEDMMYIVDLYDDGYFKKYTGETGNTAIRYIYFYDNEGNELFKMAELGNKNLVKISVDGKENIFQFFANDR